MITISKKVIKEELEEILGEASKSGARPSIRAAQMRHDSMIDKIDRSKQIEKEKPKPDIQPTGRNAIGNTYGPF